MKSNSNISKEDTIILMKNVLFKRGNNELFVIPISSKKPREYTEIEQDLQDGKITIDECENKKKDIIEIIELNKINNFRNMIRWARISRMKKIRSNQYRLL